MMFRALFLALTLFISPVYAQTLKIIVPSDNDSYNINARVLGKYISKYLPEKPTVVIQSMPGAASLVAANYIYNIAPKDGTVIGTFYKDMPLVGVLGGNNVKFESQKFTWLGSNVDGRKDAIIVWTNEYEPSLYGTENYTSVNLAFLVKDLLKSDAKIITGYADTGSARLAFEKREVDAVVYNLIGIKTQKPYWLEPGSGIKAWLQFGNGLNRHPEFKDVQTLSEMVQSEQDRQLLHIVESSLAILRPFVAPPGIPEDRATELRSAFIQAVKDPEYLDEAKKMNIDVNLIDYKEAERLIAIQTNMPKNISDKLKTLNGTK